MNELIRLVQDIEKRHQDRALLIRVGEKDIFWRDYAPRLISSIKAIGDIAIQFAPAPSSIVWSALKAVLQMSVAPGEELAAILGCSEKVLSIVRRGKVYETIYTETNTPVELLKDLTARLIAVYTKSLDLLAHVGQRLSEGYRHILLAIANPGVAKGIMADLIQCEDNLFKTAEVCEAARSAGADEHFSTLLTNLSEPLTQISDRVRNFLEEAQANETLDVLEFFSRIDFGDQHRIRAESRTSGTGEWLLQHRKFKEWEQAPMSRILWLQGTGNYLTRYGIVGMGKSFLASKVIDRFRVKTSAGDDHEADSDHGLAFFYCNRGQIDLQDPLLALQSFVRQLATCPRYSKMVRKSLIKLYRENRKNGLKLGFDACNKQLLESVNLYPQTVIILDGLDECDATSRDKLITILANLIKDAQHPVKIFISSRREQDIVKLLPAESVIRIDASDNRDDIQKFVEERMEEMERRGFWGSIPETLKSDIKTTLCKGSDGMFRWAYFQMEQLSKCQLAKEIRDRLGKLPMSLNASYHELFTGMSSYDQETLRRAVMWVMCAYKPLSSNQLLAAVRLSISGDGATLEVEDELTEETLRSICRHLVVTDSQKDEWKFPHASVIEYFEAEHKWTMVEAHSFVAKHSLLCLIDGYSKWAPSTNLRDSDSYKFADEQDDLDDLEEYVRRYWSQHINALEGLQPFDIQLSRLVKLFMGFNSSLQQTSRQYRRWIKHKMAEIHYRGVEDFFPVANPIFGICTLGFCHILEDWWTLDVDISQVNGSGLDLLSISAKNHHQHLCKKLISLGADVNRVLGDGYSSVLYDATQRFDTDMVKFLLDNKADPNLRLKRTILCMKCGKYGSALEAAALGGSIEIGRLLIEHGADANALLECGIYGSALAAAAYRGLIEFTRLLIEHGANVNATLNYGQYGSALAAAAHGQGVMMVRYLIEEASADPSILSKNPPSVPPPEADPGCYKRYRCGRYLKQKGYVVDEDVLRKVGMWPME
ncbi:uncharacterized protein TRIVIDRAFT_141868 [Trichoderma virens Gv29-8]|uniref:Nephrocystin 3-like N-terminal domain-containing protein n=1 Tax=Hypocrea virens (strain Gv29-8 / FGSC 10586) TaxID=413071 RepID=G9MGN1_HYPVG|nr:uncharacterized protein TRIVIDRAFT_141868 [Trichoderma virens Gv29-8]EHK26678.1 hypothetical protein TRIVIDRAFT_141868 [Trichoderma virens Gv29-8]